MMTRGLSVLLCIYSGSCAWCQVRFDESASDRLRLFSNTYEVALSKANGAILGITDRTANALLTAGSRNGCLWGSNFQTVPTTYLGGCSFGAARPDAFRHVWNPNESALTLQYNTAASSAQRVDA